MRLPLLAFCICIYLYLYLSISLSTSTKNHGKYSSWELRNRYARKEQSCLDLFKAFYWIKQSHIWFFFRKKNPIFFHACATCSELPFNISTMLNRDPKQSFWNCLFQRQKGWPTINLRTLRKQNTSFSYIERIKVKTIVYKSFLWRCFLMLQWSSGKSSVFYLFYILHFSEFFFAWWNIAKNKFKGASNGKVVRESFCSKCDS